MERHTSSGKFDSYTGCQLRAAPWRNRMSRRPFSTSWRRRSRRWQLPTDRFCMASEQRFPRRWVPVAGASKLQLLWPLLLRLPALCEEV